MTSVGIREFKAHLSQYVGRVKKGEAMALTEHGKTVVILSPSFASERDGKMWDLVRRGIIDWSGGHLNFKNRKLIKIKGKPMSQTVIEMRREERY